jgi:thiol-disulfide isomerase/thioredoxin
MKMGKPLGKVCLILFTVLQYFSCQSQADTSIRELTVGSKCPNFEFKNILNYSMTTCHLSDLNGRLIILDFWATWCGGCIKALKKLDSIQLVFPGDISIVPVTYESLPVVKNFLAKNEELKNIGLPTVTEDTILSKYFRYRFIPHEVWIDNHGIVKAITDDGEVNEENIRKLLSTSNINIPVKKDILNEKFYYEPLLLNDTNGIHIIKRELIYNSVLTENIPNLPGLTANAFFVGNKVKIIATNMIIQNIFKLAFFGDRNHFGPDNPNFSQFMLHRLSLEIEDSSNYYWAGKDDSKWPKEKTFCYELILPISDSNRIYRFMQMDLNRVFGTMLGIKAFVGKRKTKCWVLVRKLPLSRFKESSGKPEFMYSIVDKKGYMRNEPINILMFYLTNNFMQSARFPLVDESNLKKAINIDLDGVDLSNMHSLKERLNRYGLDFELAERNLDMLIISDKAYGG